MMHSNSILLSSVCFIVLVLTLTIDQTVQGLALAGIVRRVKNNSNNIWGGKRNSKTTRQQQRSSELPAMRKVGGVATTMGNTITTTTTTTTTTQQVAPLSSADAERLSSPYIPFDADLYRQEMRDIVYQRNMARMNL
jgi:hypothetical protein